MSLKNSITCQVFNTEIILKKSHFFKFTQKFLLSTWANNIFCVCASTFKPPHAVTYIKQSPVNKMSLLSHPVIENFL